MQCEAAVRHLQLSFAFWKPQQRRAGLLRSGRGGAALLVNYRRCSALLPSLPTAAAAGAQLHLRPENRFRQNNMAVQATLPSRLE